MVVYITIFTVFSGAIIALILSRVVAMEKKVKRLMKAQDFYIRAYNFYRNKLYEEALDDLNKAIKMQPDLFEYYEFRGDILSHLLQFEEAMLSYREAIRLRPPAMRVYEKISKVKQRKSREEAYERRKEIIKKYYSKNTSKKTSSRSNENIVRFPGRTVYYPEVSQ